MEFLWKALLVTSWLAAFLALSQANDLGEERSLQECVTANRPDCWNQINNDWWKNCEEYNTCEQCQIGCYNDEDCRGAASGLKCRIREDNEVVPGCEGNAWTGNNYCYNPDPLCWYPYIPTPAPTPSPTYNTRPIIQGSCTAPGSCTKIPRCSGLCFSNTDCDVGLYCHIGTTSVLGCDMVDQSTMDQVPSGGGFCGWAPPTAAPTQSPSISAAPSTSHASTYPNNLCRNEFKNDWSENCKSFNTCGQCQIGCSNDEDCSGSTSGLKCKIREDNEIVPGCMGDAWTGNNYCYNPLCLYLHIPTEAPTLYPTYNTKPIIEGSCTASNHCTNISRCSGICFSNADCELGLYCHLGTPLVGGCDMVDQATMDKVPPGGGFCGWAPPTAAPSQFGELTTARPTREPATARPTREPTTATQTWVPTTARPTRKPTTSRPTRKPSTSRPTRKPSTSKPTRHPITARPTRDPTTAMPTREPISARPTRDPTTARPTREPTTVQPTREPTTARPT